ncbi:MAG: hypothetical protein HY329_07850 [Chloroflexi bacterium]|nr:hypothetical protein [Chloroflexota bacterium]
MNGLLESGSPIRGEAGEPLSSRDIELLSLLASGLTLSVVQPMIAENDRTADQRLATLLAKLGASSANEAIALGYRQGILRIT